MNKVRKKIKQQEKMKSNTNRTGCSPYLLISEHECDYGVWAFVEENNLSHVVSLGKYSAGKRDAALLQMCICWCH